MAIRRRAFQTMVLTAVMLVAVSCASNKPPEDVVVKGSIRAAADLNPSSGGEPRPLLVKIFQLKSKEKFEAADLFPLLEDAETELAGDLLKLEDFTLLPGEFKAYEGDYDPQTRFIGVVGAYRDMNQAQWKDMVEMPEKSLLKLGKRGVVKIEAQSLAINISVGD